MDPQLRVQPHALPLLLRGPAAAAVALALTVLAGGAAPGQVPGPPAAGRDSAPPRDPAADGAGPAASRARAELSRRLRRLLADPALERAHVGLEVQVAETGEVLFERAAGKRFTAASTVKLVTAAAALDRLGAGFRWETRLVADGPVEGGTLRGDLWIVGGGDPGLDPSDLRAWASALRAAGVRRIAGDVIGDGRSLGPAIWGRGWMWDDLHLGWATGVTGLQLDEAGVRVWLEPGDRVGAAAALRVEDPHSEPPLEIAVETGPPGSRSRFTHLPAGAGPGPGRIEGWVPADADSIPLFLAPARPTGQLLEIFGRVLRDSSVTIDGSLRRPRRGERPPSVADTARAGAPARPDAGAAGEAPAPGAPADRRIVRTFESDSLGAVLADLLAPSDNQTAEILLRTLGRERGRAGTAEEGLGVVREVLADRGIAPEAVALADGSGLSRYDELTPAALVRLLRAVWRSPRYGTFAAALAAPGEDGTLETRLLDTPARDGLRAKTGSLSSVRGLAGYVEAGNGRTLVFALLVNGYGVPGRVAEGLRDLLVEQLSLYRRPVEPGWPGVRRDAGDGGGGPPER